MVSLEWILAIFFVGYLFVVLVKDYLKCHFRKINFDNKNNKKDPEKEIDELFKDISSI